MTVTAPLKDGVQIRLQTQSAEGEYLSSVQAVSSGGYLSNQYISRVNRSLLRGGQSTSSWVQLSDLDITSSSRSRVLDALHQDGVMSQPPSSLKIEMAVLRPMLD
jgi:hypothetical protein